MPRASLIAEQSGRFQATGLGFRFLNDLMAGFLPEENARRARASCTQRLPGTRRIGTFVGLLVRCLN